ncbi:MAG: RNA 2',3'-cyclic phosphodiesterase [Candidatus Solibacter sp.]|nr:RNA 2',3'-cyclic phosphodiesterase [Candidatus Solibacter sp.]
MRLFIGLDVPWQIRRNLELLLKHLQPKAEIAWSPLDNLHVTTKFVGEWPAHRLDELKRALTLVPRPGPMNIAIRGIGWFPNPHQPRVLYAGIQGPPALDTLSADTESACESLGIAAERRDYRPHLTLARVRNPKPLFELKRAIAELPGDSFGAFESTEFHLYQTELRPHGSLYTKLASYPLIP